MSSMKDQLYSWVLIGMCFMTVSCTNFAGKEETGIREITHDTTSKGKNEQPVIASPRRQSEGKIGSVEVEVDYGSPGVKDRKIWGKLVEYGKVWRAGANETTAIEFSGDVKIGDQQIKAGKYGFYLIPNKDETWVAILNTDWSREKHGAWGAYNYNREHDVVRIEIQPEWVKEVQERLEYTIAENSIDLAWEKARLSIPVSAIR